MSKLTSTIKYWWGNIKYKLHLVRVSEIEKVDTNEIIYPKPPKPILRRKTRAERRRDWHNSWRNKYAERSGY